MSTALYRRYRPETFSKVIGQEHVTEPLITALQNNRVNHAYLFSGPRGCGKTTSARILARCLNCAQGPTPNPCGSCDSCQELAREGSGSLDVIEMDAASHGGVDHARDLRERASFAPVRDRYKIFIIDEAHMVTREGFNALLKIVEEPPEHIKFIFATTEPGKVLSTIRSRTHHYPFRLVPPETLHHYLQALCDQEKVAVEEGVLQLVVRAGSGSVRDSLSVLDQLMAGSQNQKISYDLAVALLGYTHSNLLDAVINSFAAGQAAEVFSTVDRIIQTGQDPRRFVEDLLQRLRDLIIIQAAPQAAPSILHGTSGDHITRLQEQAQRFGSAELSRAADISNQALNEMSGATSPQLHLELLCARILLPASDQSIGGIGTRLDRLERQVKEGNLPQQGNQPSPQPARAQASRSQQGSPGLGRTDQDIPRLPSQDPHQPPTAALTQLKRQQTSGQKKTPAQAAPGQGQIRHLAGPDQAPQPASKQADTPGLNTVLMVKNAWPEILASLPSPPARTWFAQCQPSKFENGALYLRADIGTLRRVKSYLPQFKAALQELLDLSLEIHADVSKTPNPQQDPGTPAAKPSQQQDKQTPPAENPQASGQPISIAQGPRGGEEAWRTHGQPRTSQAPQWSQEDWDKKVSDWEVAPIPQQAEEGHSQEAAEPTPATPPSQASPAADKPAEPSSSAEKIGNETGPQLRVIKGEAPDSPDPLEQARENHPSSGKWRRPGISPAKKTDQNPQAADSKEEEKPAGFRQRFASQLAAGQQAQHKQQESTSPRQQTENTAEEPDQQEFTASDDDETLETTVLIGQRAVEKILGGVLIQESKQNH